MRPTLRSIVRVAGTNTLSAAALVLAATAVPTWLPVLCTLGALALIAWYLKQRLIRPGLGSLGKFGASRILIASAVVVLAARSDSAGNIPGTMAAVIILLFIGRESALARVWRSAARPVANLPGLDARRAYARHGGRLVGAGMLLLAIVALASFTGAWLDWICLVLALAIGATVAWWFRAAVGDRQSNAIQVPLALENYAPEFMIYISGPTGTGYQLKMWLPFFELLDRRFVVIAREGPLATSLAALTDRPVIAARTLAELEAVQLDSCNATFYVNNGTKNTHNVRYRHMTHVQLLHGESDKPSSYNAVTGMFDKIFVAGQAGIDRYSDHGVEIPSDRFEIVGRPQVYDITRATNRAERSIALYAPTWTGFHTDNNFGSLPVGVELVEALLAAGWTVIFRPHPYSRRDEISQGQIAAIESTLTKDASKTGRAHVFGMEACTTMTLTDCFNGSDVLVSDVSSVPADYLFSEKPFVITKMSSMATEAYLAEFRLARAGYVADMSEGVGATAAIAQLQSDDKSELRRETRIHYLGDIPAENYEQCFIETARNIIDVGPSDTVSAAHTFSIEEENATDTDSVTGVEELSSDTESAEVEDQVDE